MRTRTLLMICSLSAVFAACCPTAQGQGYTMGNPYGIVNSITYKTVAGTDEGFVERGLQYTNVAVIFSKVAVQKASNPDLRSFARVVMDKHLVIGAGLSQDAKAMGVKIPAGMTAAYQADFADLQKRTGADFDRRYLEILVRAQRDDFNVVQGAQDSHNPSLRAQSERYQVTLASLNTQAERLQKKLVP